MTNVENYRARTQQIIDFLAGRENAPGARQKIQEAKETNETVAELHKDFIAKLGETATLGRQLLDAVGLTGDQLNAAQKLTRQAEVHGSSIFDTPNTTHLQQGLRDSHQHTEQLDRLNGRIYMDLDAKLRPLFVACAHLTELPNPAISEGAFDQTAAVIAQAHQGVAEYEQHLG